MAVVLLTGYFAVYRPLSDQIDETTRKVDRDRKLLDLAGSIEQLQKQYHSLEDRLPQQVDAKEWVQYVLEGIRRLPLKMQRLDCRSPQQLGPYQVIVLHVQLEGTFFDLDTFLRWLESNQRLLRADEVRLAPAGGIKGNMTLGVTVLGMAG